MKYLYLKFIELLRSLFSKPVELGEDDFSTAYEIKEQAEVVRPAESKEPIKPTESTPITPEENNYLDYSFDDYILVHDDSDDCHDIKKVKNNTKKIKTVVDEVVNVNNITRTIKVTTDDSVIEYRRTPVRTPKYDLKVGDTTFYAWGKGEVYTTTLEGENVQVISDPKEDYEFIGFGEIL